MDKPKLLMIAYRAYGDWVYTLPVLPFLHEKYDIYAEINVKTFQLSGLDPRFKKVYLFKMEEIPLEQWAPVAEERKKMLIDEIKPDRIIDFNHSIEGIAFLSRLQPEFYIPVAQRRMLTGNKNLYQLVFERAEIPFPSADKFVADTMWFDDWLTDWGRRFREEQNAGKFVVGVVVAGSSTQKVFRQCTEYIDWVLDTYSDAVVYVMGDATCWKVIKRKSDRIFNACDMVDIRQSFMVAKQADLMVGGETGLIAAAGMFSTPKIGLFTSSSVWQIAGMHKNDFSLQAWIPCSPCMRAIFTADDCEAILKDTEGKPLRSACVDTFSFQAIQERTDYVYRNLRKSLPRGVPEAGAVGAR